MKNKMNKCEMCEFYYADKTKIPFKLDDGSIDYSWEELDGVKYCHKKECEE